MHELLICTALLEQVAACVERYGASAARRVTLRIGPLAEVEPFAELRDGTCVADAELIIVDVPLRVH